MTRGWRLFGPALLPYFVGKLKNDEKNDEKWKKWVKFYDNYDKIS